MRSTFPVTTADGAAWVLVPSECEGRGAFVGGDEAGDLGGVVSGDLGVHGGGDDADLVSVGKG